MWQPDEQQQQRIAQCAALVKPLLEEIWQVDDGLRKVHYDFTLEPPYYCYRYETFDANYQQTITRLQTVATVPDLTQGFAEVVAFPDVAAQCLTIDAGAKPGFLGKLFKGEPAGKMGTHADCPRAYALILQRIAARWSVEHPTEYAATLFIGWFNYLRAHHFDYREVDVVNSISAEFGNGGWYRPAVSNALALLCQFANYPTVAVVMEDLVRHGLQAAPLTPEQEQDERLRQQMERYQDPYLARELLKPLFVGGGLTYELFCLAAQQAIGIINWNAFEPSTWEEFRQRYSEPTDQEYWWLIREYSQRLAIEVHEHFTPDKAPLFSYFEYLPGVRFLLKACEYTEQLGVKQLKRHSSDEVSNALHHMARIERFAPEDDLAAAVETLRQFKPATLQIVLPSAGAGSGLILQALGKPALIPVLQFISRLGHLERDLFFEWDVRNGADPLDGVVDLAQFRRLVADAGEPDVRLLLTWLKRDDFKVPNALTIIEAALGANRDEVLKKLPKRNQTAVKAYGVLPLTSEEEVLERYLFFQHYKKESKQFGPERQANERAAAEVGLANLAQVAGYANPIRLEWAMEARLGQQTAPAEEEIAVGDYHLRLALDGQDPQIIARHGDRVLKSVPAEVKKTKAYTALADTQKSLREQTRRFRATLEEMMVTEQAVTCRELQTLAALPTVRPFLALLIFQLDGATFGLYDPDTGTFTDVQGHVLPAPTEVLLAHAWHLFQAGALADWQRAVVHRRLVQPFKQAFRELYLLTPAEEASGDASSRFTGHLLASKVASRLFQARGWALSDPGSDMALPSKSFAPAGIKAYFEFADAGHYLAELDEVTSDVIIFTAYPPSAGGNLPLTMVPPIIFSEVMRDADLVVSVALQREAWHSGEMYQRRGELANALLEDLGLPGVTLDGHFAHVQGKLARYRVHLGTAAIHIEPGSYLCVVPEKWGRQHAQLFLPFADGDDPKLCEIISKVLLLVNDDTITDTSITRQLQRQVGTTPPE